MTDNKKIVLLKEIAEQDTKLKSKLGWEVGGDFDSEILLAIECYIIIFKSYR